MLHCRRTLGTVAAGGLSALLLRVAEGKVSFSAGDLYRICALCKDSDDVLMLKDSSAFMEVLARQYKSLAEDSAAPISPFQDALLKETLSPFLVSRDSPERRAETTPTGLPRAPPVAKHDMSGEPTGEERLSAIWEILTDAQQSGGSTSGPGTDADADADADPSVTYRVTGNTIQLMEPHIVALERQLRQLSPFLVSQLIKALAVANYNNYRHTSLLSRRGCEVASDLPLTEVCRMYFNLNKLNTHDSLQPIVHRIQAHVKELSAKDVFLVAQCLERQPNTSSATAALMTVLAGHAVAQLPKAETPSYHRALLVSLARYDLKRHPAVPALLSDLAHRADQLHEKNLLAILQAMCEWGVGSAGRDGRQVPPSTTSCFAALVKRATEVAPTMDIRNIDALMDVLSFVSTDSSAAMEVVMARLDKDAGRLTLPQLDFTLRLLSSYPPAHGHVCVVSLAFAAALRAESMDAPALESVLVSLSLLHHFTDDFYALADVLQSQKGGFRKLEHLLTIAEHALQLPDPSETLSPAARHDQRLVGIVHKAVLGFTPTLDEAALASCRRLVRQLDIADEVMERKMAARAKQLQRGGGGRGAWGGASRSHPPHRGTLLPRGGARRGRRNHDPMADLLE